MLTEFKITEEIMRRVRTDIFQNPSLSLRHSNHPTLITHAWKLLRVSNGLNSSLIIFTTKCPSFDVKVFFFGKV